MNRKYYSDQLNKLMLVDYFLKAQFSDEYGNTTHSFDLNEESIPTVINFLTETLINIMKREKG